MTNGQVISQNDEESFDNVHVHYWQRDTFSSPFTSNMSMCKMRVGVSARRGP